MEEKETKIVEETESNRMEERVGWNGERWSWLASLGEEKKDELFLPGGQQKKRTFSSIFGHTIWNISVACAVFFFLYVSFFLAMLDVCVIVPSGVTVDSQRWRSKAYESIFRSAGPPRDATKLASRPKKNKSENVKKDENNYNDKENDSNNNKCKNYKNYKNNIIKNLPLLLTNTRRTPQMKRNM